MKLESIVYDYSNLQNAIAVALNDESPTFQAIYPSDTATSLTNVLASYGSMLQYQLVSAMANMYTDSAYSEAGIRQLAETLGNRLHGNISSEIYVSIERLTLRGMDNIFIPVGSKFVIGDLSFFNPNLIKFSKNSNLLPNIRLVQGELCSAEFTSTGISGEKFYFCEDFKCNTNMVKVYVKGEEWDTTDSFLPYVVTSGSTSNKSNVVILKTDADGRTYIKVGNNTNGKIPDRGSTIKVEYIKNEGADGNLNNSDLDISLATPLFYSDSPNRVQLKVKISAITTANGGFNTQSIETLKESSPYVFASGDRAVRREDYKAMLLNKCGYLTANVWGEYEEAKINGGYDKIMMNMVYYTGIKSIQKYDLYPISTLNLDLAIISNTPQDFYPIDGSINRGNGFFGSYVLDIKSYDFENNEVTLKYRDAHGTGILTCDPSINIKVYDNSAAFEEKIFPVNDIADLNIENISLNQDDPHEDRIKLITGGYTLSSGTINDNPTAITYDNPFQIRFCLSDKISLAGFAFKTPETADNFKYFPHKLAIFGTNGGDEFDPMSENYNPRIYENIKNNTSKWVNLTGIQTFDNNLDLNSYSDWITTKVYSPGTTQTQEEKFTASSIVPDSQGKQVIIQELITASDYEYVVKLDGITLPTNAYIIADNTITFLREDITITPENVSKLVLYGNLNDWIKYQYYVIEIYAVQNQSGTAVSNVSINQIKAIAKEHASFINYTDKNYFNIKLPIRENSGRKIYCIPENMQTYEYDVTIEGITSNSAYTVNDVPLKYRTEADGHVYEFQVKILSKESQLFEIKLSVDGALPTEILRGKSPLNISSAPFTSDPIADGPARITITSKSSVNLYASYVGNYYSNTDIQALDLPILNKYNHFTTYMEFKQPLIKNITIEMNVEYENLSTYQAVKTEIIKAVNNLFEIKPNYIGSSVNVSDIWKAVNSVSGIKRFNIINPVDNIDCMPYELINLPAENLIINDIITNEYK